MKVTFDYEYIPTQEEVREHIFHFSRCVNANLLWLQKGALYNLPFMKYALITFLLALMLVLLLVPAKYTFALSLTETYEYIPEKKPETYTGKMSWYGEKECLGCRTDRITACGIRFNERDYIIASNTLECGTKVKITKGSKEVEAVVQDTGGFNRYNRIADASKATFAALAPLEEGIIEVVITVLE